jgi:mRNA interferase HicA
MVNPESQRATVLPDWGNRDLKIGTIKAAVKQLGIEWDTFSRT